jgi:hypothetical protein
VFKPRSDFYRTDRWNDGLHPYCKSCFLAHQRHRRFERLDRANPDRRQWSRRHARHDYFSAIDTPEKAYHLGLLAADGNVLDSVPRITLELAVKDLILVEHFRDAIAPGVRIRRRPPRGLGRQETAFFAITSAELVNDLGKWGIVPRKTWSYSWPDHLPHEMKRPYLLGHFDGDGFTTISRHSGKYEYGRWGIVGTHAFLDGVCSFLQSELGLARRKIYSKSGIATIYFTGRSALVIDEWLHRGLEFGLERKRLRGRVA